MISDEDSVTTNALILERNGNLGIFDLFLRLLKKYEVRMLHVANPNPVRGEL